MNITNALTKDFTWPFSGRLGDNPNSGSESVDAFSLVQISSDAITTGRPQPLKHGNSIFFPFVASTGHHWLYEIDATTKAVLNTLQLSTDFAGVQDDHSGSIGLLLTPGGGLLVVYAGHNTDDLIRFRYSANATIAGFGAEYSIDVGGATTYPQLYLLPSGRIICWFRRQTTMWAAVTTTNEGSAAGQWSNVRQVIESPNQLYANLNANGNDTTIGLAGDQPNLGSSQPYIFEVDWSTGNVSSLSGVVSNFLNSTPKLTASAPSDCEVFFTPGATESAGIGDWDQFGGVVLGVREENSQFSKRYYCTPPANSANRLDPAEWTFTPMFDSYYGVGIDHDPAYSYFGEIGSLETPGLDNPTVLASRCRRNVWSLDMLRSEAADGTGPWNKVMHYDSMPRSSTDLMGRPRTITNSSDFGYYKATPFNDYTDWDSVLIFPRITSIGSSAPTISVNTNWNYPEYSTFALPLTVAGGVPFGAEVTGGADQALFFIHNNTLYMNPKAQASPEDGNTDNVYTCEVTLTSLSLQQSVVTFNVTIQSALAARTNRLSKSHSFNDAAWTKTGCTVPATALTDPLGGSNACRIVQAADFGVHHRVQQTITLAAATKQTLSVWAKYDGARFLGIAAGAGTGNPGFKGIFDLIKGDYVSRGDATNALALDDYGIFHDPAWGADWWFIFLTATTTTTSSGSVTFSVQDYSAPNSTEDGLTANRVQLYGAQLANGTVGNYQDVA